LIILAYPGYAIFATQIQAAANTQSAGRAIAHMFNELKNAGFRAADFECSGHSLGSHLCSYAAKYTKSNFGFTISRVTGMDPATVSEPTILT